MGDTLTMTSTSVAESPGRLRDRLNRHRHLVALSMAIAVLVLAAASAFAWAALHDKHTDGRWALQASDAALPLGLTITIDGNEVQGEGPCNTFGATWSQDEGVSALRSSLVGCASEVMLQEERYFGLLNGTTSVEVEQNRMTLSGPAGSMMFVRSD